MQRPKKKTRHYRRLAAAASQAARSRRIQSVDTGSDPAGPASDGEGSQDSLQSLSDQEIFLLEDESPESIAESNIAEAIDNNILTWKDGAGSSLHPVYLTETVVPLCATGSEEAKSPRFSEKFS
jgi:hypothetical protein